MDLIFDAPDRFVAGAIGHPGSRTFVLQARQGGALASVIVEKEQIRALLDRMKSMLEGIAELGEVDVPARPDIELDKGPLDAPLEPEFRVGDIRIGWDRASCCVIVELAALDDDRQLSVQLSLYQAQDFVARAENIVTSGRPPCPFCAQPVDPAGHICPRSNGYRTALFG